MLFRSVGLWNLPYIFIYICSRFQTIFVDLRNPLLDLGILHLVIIITLSSPFRLYVLGQELEGYLKKNDDSFDNNT